MKQKFGPIIIAAILFCLFIFLPSSLFYPLIPDSSMKNEAASLNPDVFQGVAIQEKMWADKTYLPMFGSSELSRFDEFHPYNYFKVTDHDLTPFLIGRGGMQSLVHYLDLASMSKNLKNKKLVFIISPQWFQPKGIDEVHFAPNFSNLQAYRFVFNSDIPKEQKKYIAKRLLTFKIVRSDKVLKTMLKNETHQGNFIHDAKAIVTKPVAYTYMKILEKKDIVQSIFNMKPKKVKYANKEVVDMSFSELQQRAIMKGEKAANNNPFHILNNYYSRKIFPKLRELRNYNAKGSYNKSPEYDDLQQILDLLKQNNTKALFVSIPVNGYWYDYSGFSKEERARYYGKITSQIKENGFEIADYSNHEYDKYFLRDTIHIGWKGWTYIDEDMKKFHAEDHVQKN